MERRWTETGRAVAWPLVPKRLERRLDGPQFQGNTFFLGMEGCETAQLAINLLGPVL